MRKIPFTCLVIGLTAMSSFPAATVASLLIAVNDNSHKEDISASKSQIEKFEQAFIRDINSVDCYPSGRGCKLRAIVLQPTKSGICYDNIIPTLTYETEGIAPFLGSEVYVLIRFSQNDGSFRYRKFPAVIVAKGEAVQKACLPKNLVASDTIYPLSFVDVSELVSISPSPATKSAPAEKHFRLGRSLNERKPPSSITDILFGQINPLQRVLIRSSIKKNIFYKNKKIGETNMEILIASRSFNYVYVSHGGKNLPVSKCPKNDLSDEIVMMC